MIDLSTRDLLQLSPAELTRDILVRLSLPGLAPAGVVVGPANDTQQQNGVISITPAGLPELEMYVPVQWTRVQVRCLAGTLSDAEAIAQRVYPSLNGRNRIVARQASTDQRFLVHAINVNAGPSVHYDSPETWESLLFAEIMLSTAPLN